MRRITLSLTICLAGAAHAASILDFNPAALGASQIIMPSTYGDRLPGTPNIDLSYVTVAYTPQTFGGAITGLAVGLYPSFASADIVFTPDPGYGVELISFDLAMYQGATLATLRLLDGNDNVLMNLDSRTPFYFGGSGHYTPGYLQPGVLKLEFSDNEYIGLDNIQFDQFQINTGTPEPGTLSALCLGLASLVWVRRRRRKLSTCCPVDSL